MSRIGVSLFSILLASCAAPYDHLAPEQENRRDISDARGAFQRGHKLDAVGELARVANRPGGDAALNALFVEDPRIKAQVIDAATIANSKTLDPYWLLRRLGELWVVSDAALPEIRPELQRIEAEAIQAIRAGAFDFEVIRQPEVIRAFSDPNLKFDVLVDALLKARKPSPTLATELARTRGVAPEHPARRRLADRFGDRGWTFGELSALEPLQMEEVNAALRTSRAPVGPEYAPFVAKALDFMTRDLKDPLSVQYRDVFLSRSPRGDIVCGEMNAKNSYGGYRGFVRFYSDGVVRGFDENDARRDRFNSIWDDLCVYQSGVVRMPN